MSFSAGNPPHLKPWIYEGVYDVERVVGGVVERVRDDTQTRVERVDDGGARSPRQNHEGNVVAADPQHRADPDREKEDTLTIFNDECELAVVFGWGCRTRKQRGRLRYCLVLMHGSRATLRG